MFAKQLHLIISALCTAILFICEIILIPSVAWQLKWPSLLWSVYAAYDLYFYNSEKKPGLSKESYKKNDGINNDGSLSKIDLKVKTKIKKEPRLKS